MRLLSLILLNLAFCTLLSAAEEKLPTLKVGSDVYTNVVVTSVTAKDIYFTHNKGMGNAKLKNLEPAMQKHFNYDAAKIEAAEQKLKAASAPPNPADPKAVMDDAIARVKAIVNQPVTPIPQTPEMEPSISEPGWFHDGAIKPDFNIVDIRTTQDLQYDKRDYVTSDVNPGFVFNGHLIEFNSMTKYFYIDRTLPKKRLTEAEMLEINRLYRIIGTCETKLKAVKQP